VSIGINVPVFPQFQPVPGYPVYYAPEMDANYFFYDGMFWVYQADNWYASSWYNGPWTLVEPMVVPVFILRVPVRYYREPPVYFRGAPLEAPPPWGAHYGNDWQRQRGGWDHWNRGSAPPPAPLPTYQKQYSGPRYPPPEQQRTITKQNYSYQPRDPVVRQHFERVESQKGAAVAQKPDAGAQKPDAVTQKQDRPPRASAPADSQPSPTQHDAQHQPAPPPVVKSEPSHQPQDTRREPAQSQQPDSQHQPPRPEAPKTEPQHQPQQQASEPDRAPPEERKQEQRKDESVDKERDREGQQDNR
jgi:hypothetical protein